MLVARSDGINDGRQLLQQLRGAYDWNINRIIPIHSPILQTRRLFGVQPT
jgi:hypothetical protein